MNSSYDFSFKKRAVVLSAAATATAATLLWRWSRKKTTATVPIDDSLPVPTLCPSLSPSKPNSTILNLLRTPNPRGFSDLLVPPSNMMTSTSKFMCIPTESRQSKKCNNTNNVIKKNSTNRETSAPPNVINHQIGNGQASNVVTPENIIPPSPGAPSTTQPTIHHKGTPDVQTDTTAIIAPTATAVPVVSTASVIDSVHVTPPAIATTPTASLSLSTSWTGKSITVKRWVDTEDGYSRVPSYRLHKLLGSGAYGEVWHATDVNGVEVAIKIFKTVCDPEERKMNCLREYSILSEFHTFKWVAKVFGLCDVEMEVIKHAIVMEYISGGMLRDQLRGGKRISEKRSAKIIAQVAEALYGLHSQTVIHKDVKPHNILMCGRDSDDIKLIDFGIAKRASDLNGEEDPGTELFSAPEVLKKESYGTPVDMFALGVTLYRMLYGKMPFMTEKIVVSGVDVMFSDARVKISDEAKDLLKKLLSKTPRMRPVASDIKSHPWIMRHL